jgi:hypothetical protein
MANHDGYLPAVPSRISPAASRRTQRAHERAEIELHSYAIQAWTTSMMDQIDTAALGEAIRASAEEEMDTYDEMMLIAGDSRVKQQIVMRKLAIMSNTDNARLRRRFR